MALTVGWPLYQVKQKLGSLPPQIFSALDQDGDGYLTPDELRSGFEAMGDPLTEPELMTIISVAGWFDCTHSHGTESPQTSCTR